jgi:hypothetical protein
MKQFPVERAMDWSYEDIDYARELRKRFANEEQAATDKSERKYCQRMVKATTLVLEHMTGYKGGKWDGEPLRRSPEIPLELEENVRTVFFYIDEEWSRRRDELSKTAPTTD